MNHFTELDDEEAGAAEGAEEAKDRIVRRYSNEQITVIWQPHLCDHNGNCIRSLPEVFNIKKRPWVDISGADSQEIGTVVAQCPTGALSLEEKEMG